MCVHNHLSLYRVILMFYLYIYIAIITLFRQGQEILGLVITTFSCLCHCFVRSKALLPLLLPCMGRGDKLYTKDFFYFLLNTTVFNPALLSYVHMPNKPRTFLYYIENLIYNIYTIDITTSYFFYYCKQFKDIFTYILEY